MEGAGLFGGLRVGQCEGVELLHGGDVDRVVEDGGGGADGAVEAGFAEHLFFGAGFENPEVTAAGSEVDFSIGEEGGGPDFAFRIERPDYLPGFVIDAVEVASAVGGEGESVMDGY
ncbi:MAG: hypothetical protein RI897_2581 [Verrucomicrobiota bacterium]